MKKKKELAKERYARNIMDRAKENGGVVRLCEVEEIIGKSKTYAWSLMQELVEEGIFERRYRGLYFIRKAKG